MKASRLEFLGSLRSDEAQPVLRAIDRGRELHGLSPRTAAFWDWRAAQPGGAVLGAAWDGDRVLAAIVGMKREVLLEGQPSTWIEVVELFNDFEAGRGLSRTAPLLELGTAFAKRFGGQAPEACPVLFGLPSRRAHRIGLARLGQEILRSENVLVADPSTYEAQPGSAGTHTDASVEVTEVDAFPDEVGACFQRFAEGRRAIGVRSKAWLDWRFCRHPERDYRIALARRADELVGYAVQRRGTYAGKQGGVLADWLVPPGDAGCAWELLVWAAGALREDGGDVLLINVPDKSPEWAALQSVAFQAHGTQEYLAFRGFMKPFVMSWLFANWHYTLADSERG